MAGTTTTARSGGCRRWAAGRLGGIFFIASRGSFLFIISFVKAGTFKDHAGAAADQTRQFIFMAFGAFGQFSICHGLQFIKGMSAGLAFVFIGWHKILQLSFERFLEFIFKRRFPVILA